MTFVERKGRELILHHRRHVGPGLTWANHPLPAGHSPSFPTEAPEGSRDLEVGLSQTEVEGP